jgi:hypothetical protein
MNDRIEAMKDRILEKGATVLGVTMRAEETFPDRIRILFNALEQTLYTERTNLSAYETRLWAEERQDAVALLDDLRRLRRFMAFSEDYVRETLTVERFLEVLALLEREVLGRNPLYGWRNAVVKVGPPTDLAVLQDRYQQRKRETVAEVTRALEEAMQSLLNELSPLGSPLR